MMLFIIMLGLFVQFAGENVPKILQDNRSLLMQILWVMLFLGCFVGWKIDFPKIKSRGIKEERERTCLSRFV